MDQYNPEENQAVNSQPHVKYNLTDKNKKTFLYGFLGFIGVVIVFALGFGVYRVYAKVGTDVFTVTVAKALRLPAVKVNGSVVTYGEYIDDLNAITKMRDFDKQSGGPAGELTATELSDQVLYRQVNNVLIGDLAKKYGVTVASEDVDAVKKDILEKEFETQEKAEQAISERYGWSFADFEEKVIKPFVLQTKLSEKIKNNTEEKNSVRGRAEQVLAEIKGGADFSTLAQKYGEDGTAAKGGDLGWFGKGEMVPAFENAAFALEKGKLSESLVESQFGYHILIVDDKKTEKVKDEKGKSVNQELVKARHILFQFPSLEKSLNEAAKTADIHVYPNINNPFEVLQKQGA